MGSKIQNNTDLSSHVWSESPYLGGIHNERKDERVVIAAADTLDICTGTRSVSGNSLGTVLSYICFCYTAVTERRILRSFAPEISY